MWRQKQGGFWVQASALPLLTFPPANFADISSHGPRTRISSFKCALHQTSCFLGNSYTDRRKQTPRGSVPFIASSHRSNFLYLPFLPPLIFRGTLTTHSGHCIQRIHSVHINPEHLWNFFTMATGTNSRYAKESRARVEKPVSDVASSRTYQENMPMCRISMLLEHSRKQYPTGLSIWSPNSWPSLAGIQLHSMDLLHLTKAL
jgi:hypothetical protein